MSLMLTEKTIVTDFYDNWKVHSPKQTFKVPATMVVLDYVKFKKNPRYSRSGIFLRDDFICKYCNKGFERADLTIDHVHPKSMGGKTTWENVVAACLPCNCKRGHKKEILPSRMPYKPTFMELENKARNRQITVKHPSWEIYLQWDPKLVTKDYRV